MSRRQTGLVVGKDFRPPEGAEPLDWCYLTVDVSDEERVSVRIRRDQVSRADVGDVIRFKMPRDTGHPVSRVTWVASDPSLLPPLGGNRPSR